MRIRNLYLLTVPLAIACGGKSGSMNGQGDGGAGSTSESTESGDSGGDGDSTSGDGDSTSGDGDSTSGDGDSTSGDGDSTSGDGDSTGGDGDSTGGDGDSTGGDGDTTTGGGGSGSGDCPKNEQDNDGDLSCAPACDDDSCSGNGTCSDDSGKVKCECDDGWGSSDCSSIACAGIDCGDGSCVDSGDTLACSCDTGFQDKDGDLSCAPACADSSCSGNGTCSDETGAVACECSDGYAGDACDSCDTAAGYAGDGVTCGYPVVGDRSEGDPGRWGDNTVAKNCQEYLIPPEGYVYEGNVGDGYYTISPNGLNEITVYCDQTTTGGGWTMFDPALGQEAFGAAITVTEGTCELTDGTKPTGRDTNGAHDCFFDYDLGFEFSEVSASNFEVAIRAQNTDTSDLIFENAGWGENPCGTQGDVQIGGVSDTGPVLSLGQVQEIPSQCGSYVQFDNLSEPLLMSGQAVTVASQVLRIRMNEGGGQSEGWEWVGGMMGVRDSVNIAGALSQADPGSWADGRVAVDCDEYTMVGVLDGVIRVGSEEFGYYLLDPEQDGSPVTALCGSGDTWTEVMNWDPSLNEGDTLDSFLANFTDQVAGPPTGISPMGELVFENESLIWSDASASADVLSLALDLSSFSATKIHIDVDYYGHSMEESSVFFFAETASSTFDLACHENQLLDSAAYSTEEEAMIPYDCANTAVGSYTIAGGFEAGDTEILSRFVLRSLMHDINRGDYSQLHSLKVYVR